MRKMFGPRVPFLTRATWFILASLAFVFVHCKRSGNSSNCAELCGRNIGFGCNCLDKTSIKTYNCTESEVRMSNVYRCDASADQPCLFRMEINQELEAEFTSWLNDILCKESDCREFNVSMRIRDSLEPTFLALAEREFGRGTRGTKLAQKTGVGFNVDCSVSHGRTGWISQKPIFYHVTAQMALDAFGSKPLSWSSNIATLIDYSYKMPIVYPTGINAGELICHEEKPTHDTSERRHDPFDI